MNLPQIFLFFSITLPHISLISPQISLSFILRRKFVIYLFMSRLITFLTYQQFLFTCLCHVMCHLSLQTILRTYFHARKKFHAYSRGPFEITISNFNKFLVLKSKLKMDNQLQQKLLIKFCLN